MSQANKTSESHNANDNPVISITQDLSTHLISLLSSIGPLGTLTFIKYSKTPHFLTPFDEIKLGLPGSKFEQTCAYKPASPPSLFQLIIHKSTLYLKSQISDNFDDNLLPIVIEMAVPQAAASRQQSDAISIHKHCPKSIKPLDSIR